MGTSPKPDFDYDNNLVTPKKKRLRIHAFLLPQNGTYNPVGRRIREPVGTVVCEAHSGPMAHGCLHDCKKAIPLIETNP